VSVRFAVAVGVLEVEHLRTMRDICAILVWEDTLRESETFSEGWDLPYYRLSEVINDEDLIGSSFLELVEVFDSSVLWEAFFDLFRVLLDEFDELEPWDLIDGIERVHLSGLSPETAGIVK